MSLLSTIIRGIAPNAPMAGKIGVQTGLAGAVSWAPLLLDRFHHAVYVANGAASILACSLHAAAGAMETRLQEEVAKLPMAEVAVRVDGRGHDTIPAALQESLSVWGRRKAAK